MKPVGPAPGGRSRDQWSLALAVAVNSVESLGMRAADGWVRNRLEYVFHARRMSDMHLGMDHGGRRHQATSSGTWPGSLATRLSHAPTAG
jgi:hypothetical protein